MNIIPGIDFEQIKKHGDPSRPDYKIKHPGGKRGGGIRRVAGKKKTFPTAPAPNGNGTSRAPRTPAPGGRSPQQTGKLSSPELGTKENPIITDNVDEAAQALIAGKHVQLTQKRQVSVLLEKLFVQLDEIKKKGADAPDIDLCKVTVKGTNLFCTEAMVKARKDEKGQERGARYFMPQLKSIPEPGGRADRELEKDDKGEVDIQPMFREMLRQRGVKIESGTEKASFLKATQEYLRAEKVAGMVNSIQNFRLNRPGRKMPTKGNAIFISKDGYIVDGHHRWGAIVAVDLEDGVEGDIDMDIERIDLPIIDLLELANDFADEWGMKRFEKALATLACTDDLFLVVNTLGRYEAFDRISKARVEYMRQLDQGHDVYLLKKKRRHKKGCT